MEGARSPGARAVRRVISGTMASLGCPAGSREPRALVDDHDDPAERAACARPLR